jgi:hypothetical protein
MDNGEAWKIYEKYIGAWNATSVEQRLKIASEILSDGVEYYTPRHDRSVGQSKIMEDIASFHENFPGGHFEIGDVSAHHDVALLTWVIVQAERFRKSRPLRHLKNIQIKPLDVPGHSSLTRPSREWWVQRPPLRYMD